MRDDPYRAILARRGRQTIQRKRPSKTSVRSMSYRVEITSRASHDLDLIPEWSVDREAGDTGLGWFRGVSEAMASLSQNPRRCPPAPGSVEFPFEYDSSCTQTACLSYTVRY
jgi:hypothetical protein